MIKNYVLSVLGVVLLGIVVDIIIPTGQINKYIKSVYSIFVVMVLISPVIKFFKSGQDLKLNYTEYEINEKLLNYIYSKQADETEVLIETILGREGFSSVDIILCYSIENKELIYNSCQVNVENMSISSDKQHINSYEFIRNVVSEKTGLKDEVIMVYGW